MVKVRDLAGFQHLPENAYIKVSGIWNRQVDTITPVELIAFLKNATLKGYGYEGSKSVEVLIGELRKYIGRGEIKTAPLETFPLPVRTYSLTSLYEEFQDFTPMRRHALVVSILSGLSLAEVVTLKRNGSLRYKLDNISQAILSKVPAHISTEYLFWEYKGKRLTFLFDLPEQFKFIGNHDIQHYRDNLDLTNKMSDDEYWIIRRAFWRDFISSI